MIFIFDFARHAHSVFGSVIVQLYRLWLSAYGMFLLLKVEFRNKIEQYLWGFDKEWKHILV